MRGLLLDTNLLVLLVVGLANEGWIKSHKALSAYNLRDFQELRTVLTGYDGLYVTPSTLTECSNLSRQIAGDARRRVSLTLGQLIHNAAELHVRSVEVCSSESYLRLGLADAVLLVLLNRNITLLTADFDLYQAACGIAPDRSVNFNHLPHRSELR